MKNNVPFVAGYVRLSRDDNKKNYISIENQKLMLLRYAEQQGWEIQEFYEDDGFSGYSFDRPAFQKLKLDLVSKIDILIAKDLSRLGRHNAKVLLFLEEMSQMGKRLVLIDDQYDTKKDEDDIIGIKTWYNERYVKDASRKIKSVLRVKQKEGALAVGVPYGYQRKKQDKTKIEPDPLCAGTVKLIFDLYMEGRGFRNISSILNEKKIPTPSQTAQKKAWEENKTFNKSVCQAWSPVMVGDIIKNDFYIGTLRHHKKERVTINGKERKVKEEEQFVFENNHDPLVQKEIFIKAQETLGERKIHKYRGEYRGENLFSGLLFCKDCGKRLTAVHRGKKCYYICATYNKKGKAFCNDSHIIYECILTTALKQFYNFWMNENSGFLENLDLSSFYFSASEKSQNRELLKKNLEKYKQELKALILHKVKDCSENLEFEAQILESYQELEKEKLNMIFEIENQLNQMNDTILSEFSDAKEAFSKLFIENFTNQDLKFMIDRIEVEKTGSFQVYFKHML